jgi:hypothetical protein
MLKYALLYAAGIGDVGFLRYAAEQLVWYALI